MSSSLENATAHNLADAFRICLTHLPGSTLVEELVSTPISLDRVLSRNVCAPEPFPGHPRSMMDGFGVCSSEFGPDAAVTLRVDPTTSSSYASRQVVPDRSRGAPGGTQRLGFAVYVATGGVVPDGYDAVVKIEDVESESEESVTFVSGLVVDAGQCIRKIGSDVSEGQVLGTQGELVGNIEIGVFVSCGVKSVPVWCVPSVVVGVLSTGDEVVEWNEEVVGGGVRDANRGLLMGAIRKEFGELVKVVDLGIVRDVREDVRKAFLDAKKNGIDVVLSTGGVSMGRRDFVRPVLREIGNVHFEKLAVKPGKPLTFATMESEEEDEGELLTPSHKMAVFALPGNPVSAMMGFRNLAQPCIWSLCGRRPLPEDTVVKFRLAECIRRIPSRLHYVRMKVFWHSDRNELVAVSTGNQNSSCLFSLKSCNGFAMIDPGTGIVKSGDIVNGILTGPVQILPLGFDFEVSSTRVVRSCGCGHAHDAPARDERVLPVLELSVGVVTISDRASSGEYEDLSGPLICEILKNACSERVNWEVCSTKIVPDEIDEIVRVLTTLADLQKLHLILTTGGTGFSPRDVTPEATRQVISKDASSLIFGMQALCLPRVPMAMLSRAVAGIRGSSLIVNLPGSPKAVRENLEILLKARIHHALKLLGTSSEVPDS